MIDIAASPDAAAAAAAVSRSQTLSDKGQWLHDVFSKVLFEQKFFHSFQQLEIELTINSHKQLEFIFSQQGVSKNFALTISKDFCFQLVNPN